MGERARILIVDDDESIRKTISTILKEKGYCVDTAENGEEAIEKTSTKFYNLALVDIKLSDMEGTELLPLMRETTPRMIKIIVTGFPSLQNAIEAVNRNADAYIIKPVRIDELLAVIKEQLEMQEENRRYSEERVAEFIETRMRELEKERTVVARKSR